MGWGFFDDHFDEHPKVMAAFELEPLAPWGYVCGVLYCRRAGTPGALSKTQVERLVPGRGQKIRRALIAAGLWEECVGGGVLIHDWDHWNHAAEQRSASARNAAQIRWRRERESKAKAGAE